MNWLHLIPIGILYAVAIVGLLDIYINIYKFIRGLAMIDNVAEQINEMVFKKR